MKRRLKFLKLGVLSIRRLGITALIGLVLGGYLLLTASDISRSVSEEKQLPCEMVVTGQSITDETINSIYGTEGIIDCTPVIILQDCINVGDYNINLPVYAVLSSWLKGFDISGSSYPDSSAMPFIVLGQQALEGFTDKNGRTVLADSVNWQSDPVTLGGTVSEICGVLTDRSDARAYISIASARNVILNRGDIPEYSQVWLRLEDSSYEEAVTNALGGLGLYPSNDSSSRWEDWAKRLLESRLRALCGACVAAFAFAVITEKTKRDIAVNRAQYTFLSYMGATGGERRSIHAARIAAYTALSAALCICVRLFVKSLN